MLALTMMCVAQACCILLHVLAIHLELTGVIPKVQKHNSLPSFVPGSHSCAQMITVDIAASSQCCGKNAGDTLQFNLTTVQATK